MDMNHERKTTTSLGEMTKGVQHTMVTLTLSCLLHLLFFFVLSAMAGDVDLLISFKNSLPNPKLLSNWNHTHGVCKFQGITCKRSHVSSLTIRGLPLEAYFNSVSAYILSLENLEALSLHSTNLTGSISALPAKCASQLAELDLSSNNLEGSVYDTTSLATSCHSLQSLNLSNNYIGQAFNHSSRALPRLKILDFSNNNITTNGDIQWLFSQLRLLKYLDLSNNTIKGTIPQITYCTSLQYLDLSSNQLTGTILAGTFSSCLNLTYLNLSSNHFTGMAPPDIEAWTNLVTLSLSHNNFSGKFPILSLVATPKLQFLELSFNNFSSSIPKSISKLRSVKLLDLSANRFSGLIPQSLCTSSISRLQVLRLQDNYFTGSIPHSLSNCTNLISLDMSLNLLSGSIPDSLGSLSNLRDLIMWQNNLHGEIPGDLSSLKSLKTLLLDYNNLTGAIPDGLVNCTNLNFISLSNNRLTGSIPIWIGTLEKLVILILGNNSFIGPIPPEIGDCKDLMYLSLHNNQLSGSIPPSLAKQSGKIVLEKSLVHRPYVEFQKPQNSQCHGIGNILDLDGIQTDDLMCFPSTQYCNFTRFYTGVIGTSQPSNNVSMVHLDLSYNQLEGPIPTEISAMQYMLVLDLSHNRLSGPLPQELGGMTHLFLLYLSYNTFEGRIPSSFSALSLSRLDLSNNQLSGPIPELGSLITFPKYVFENNSGLCGLPLPPCNDLSMPKGDVPQQSSTNPGLSQGWWIALGLLFFSFLIIGFVIGQFL